MIRKYKKLLLAFLLFQPILQTIQAQDNFELKSPDEDLLVTLSLAAGQLSYSVQYKNRTFLEASPLGLSTSIGDFTTGMKYIGQENRQLSKRYQMHNAKTSDIQYRANETKTSFINEENDTLTVIFRLSNHNIAFCYELKGGNQQTSVVVKEEATGFDLPTDATVFLSHQALPMTGWEQTKPSYEEEYLFDQPLGTPSLNGVGFTFPALFKVKDQGWILISETGVDSKYVGARLGEGNEDGLYPVAFPQPGENNGLTETFAGMALPAQTAWRTITVGESLKPIVESTIAFDVVEPKYEPSIDYKMGRATWSWIVWQDPSINYEDQIKFIDLAHALDFEYILIDNWWDRNIGRDRIEELIEYARNKGVSVILWYNSNGYWNNAPQTPQDRMDTAPARNAEMAWMQKIGVKGIKVDFFGGDKQHTMQLYEDILTDANNYGIAVTFHGCTLPRGWQRMFPNFVTSEAVLASENLVFRQDAMDKHALNATILPFTRNAVGSMDFAPVFLNQRLSKDQERGTIRRTTDAFELATAVLYFSPVQHFGLTPNNLEEQPAFVIDFLRKVPSVWDETVFIDGVPGDYCVIARRKGAHWYVAAVNGEDVAKNIRINLPMLKGAMATVLYDEADRTAGEKNIQINKHGEVALELLPQGGAVIVY